MCGYRVFLHILHIYNEYIYFLENGLEEVWFFVGLFCFFFLIWEEELDGCLIVS